MSDNEKKLYVVGKLGIKCKIHQFHTYILKETNDKTPKTLVQDIREGKYTKKCSSLIHY